MERRIARYLVYLDRAKRVLWYVIAWLVELIFMKVVLVDSGFGEWFFSHLLISLTGSLFLLPIIAIVFGYIEKVQFRAHEQEDLSFTDPSYQDAIMILYDIYGKVQGCSRKS